MRGDAHRRCVLVGDVMMDISAIIETDITYASDTPASITVVPGGGALSTAAWMATLGSPVTLIGCVGPDDHGRFLRERLLALGVDAHLRQGTRATGACVVLVDRHRERTMFPDSGANAEITADDIVPHLGPDTHLHLSGYTVMNPLTRQAALQACERAADVGATLSLDPASAGPMREHLAMMRDLLPVLDLIIANHDEAAVLTGEADPESALEVMLEGVPCAVVKLGRDGAIAGDRHDVVRQGAPRVEVRDTTGAGDAFTAGFLPPWLRGEPLASAVARGQEAAGRCVSRVGTSPLDP